MRLSRSLRPLPSWLIAGLAAAALTSCNNRPSQAEQEYEVCYRHCMSPPQGECKPGHPWCVLACRGEAKGLPVVTARLDVPADSTPPMNSLLAHDVGVETVGGVFTPLIRKCTELPAEVTEVFSTAVDNQPTVEVALFTGDAPAVRDNQIIGRFQFGQIRPAPRAVPQIEVRLRIDKNGKLEVLARDLETGPLQTTRTAQR
jgi:hypothetical protein